MADSYFSAWFELAAIGLVTSFVTNGLLSWGQAAERCAPALACEGRAALLKATAESSASGWARVVRAGLTDAAPARVFDAERSRIRRFVVIGLAGIAATLAGAAALLFAQPVAMAVIALVAVRIAWKLLANARAAAAALGSALRAALSFPASLRSRPGPAGHDVRWVAVRTPVAIGYGLLVIAMVLIAGIVLEASQPVSAHEIGMLVGAHVVFFPLVLAPVVLLQSTSAAVDGARREVQVVRRVVGIAYARTSVPLEIVQGFSVAEERQGRGTDTYLVADTTEGPLRLVIGEKAATAAAALARALG